VRALGLTLIIAAVAGCPSSGNAPSTTADSNPTPATTPSEPPAGTAASKPSDETAKTAPASKPSGEKAKTAPASKPSGETAKTAPTPTSKSKPAQPDLPEGEKPPAVAGMPKSPGTAGPNDRVAAVAAGHPLHARVEGTGFENRCTTDEQCHLGGCSREVCSASPDVNTTCDVQSWPQGKASCGCVSGSCIWYTAAASQNEPCGDHTCGPGLECARYYGIAGPRGPEFTQCVLRCAKDKSCPGNQTCVTIADGPGEVCMPGPGDRGGPAIQ